MAANDPRTDPSSSDHVESGATAQPALASCPDILDRVVVELAGAGVAGESRAIRLIYLIVTTRLLQRPVSVAVKGPSGGGKSYLVGEVLKLFPPDAFHAITAMSDKALLYDETPLVHRMFVVYEASGISSETASYLVRSLLSEGRIHYQTSVRTKGGGWGPLTVLREGPTGLITTTTAVSLHPENETRLVSLTVNDTPAQTAAVMLAHARGPRQAHHDDGWPALQTWLADGSTEVAVPYAEALAAAIPPVAVRLRRDFPTLLSLIRAHALLHRATREVDGNGRVVATLDDYASVRELVWDLMAETAERSVSPLTRATIEAVERLLGVNVDGDGVTQTQVATELGIDKSTAMRRARMAIGRGFLRNLESGRGRPARLVIGDPVPADGSLLPTATELDLRLRGCAPDDATDLPVEVDYPKSAWSIDDEPAEMASTRGSASETLPW